MHVRCAIALLSQSQSVTDPGEYETYKASSVSALFLWNIARARIVAQRGEPAWFRRGTTVPESESVVRIELPPGTKKST
jgi:hypothetical protein